MGKTEKGAVWLDKKLFKLVKFIPGKDDSFTLSNRKITKKINVVH